ncbi:MAG: hypothetical protein MI724_11175 [Spirochaetales bacterium]|nr:hypothetical protein [Spirochaetales bacterium]
MKTIASRRYSARSERISADSLSGRPYRRTGTKHGGSAALLLVCFAVAVASCDLALYDADAVEGARRAADLRLEAEERYTGWEWRIDDSQRPIQPQAFFPDGLTETIGYAVHDDDGSLRVWRVDNGGIVEGSSLPVSSDEVHDGWNAWSVPLDAAVQEEYLSANPDARSIRPPLFVATWNNEEVALTVFHYDADMRLLSSYAMDLEGLFDQFLGSSDDYTFYSVNVVAYGPNSSIDGGSPLGTVSGAYLQVLALSNTPFVLREYWFRGTATDFVAWAVDGDHALLAANGTVADKQIVPFPTRSDGENAQGIRHGTDFSTLNGVLSFRDGDFSAAPYLVYEWESDNDSDSLELLSWTGIISSMTMDGTVRNARTGTFDQVSGIADALSVRTETNGLLWYAGRYPDGGGSLAGLPDPGSVSLHDVYTQVSVVRGIGDDDILSVAVYSTR